MQFEFATANRIIFGNGTSTRIGELAAEHGTRVFLVTGLAENITQRWSSLLGEASLSVMVYPVNGEPTIESIQKGVDTARQFKPEVVIGFGGGSTLDSAKAIASLITSPSQVTDYLEVIGKGISLTRKSIPVIAIPTTAGTGSEVTQNAVIGAPEHGVKVSLRSPFLLPSLAIIDPELSYSMPPDLTASTGLDAITQLIEPFLCNTPNPITDGYCREGISRSARALFRAYKNGQDSEARQDMSLASLLSGMALANARLGAVHGFAGVLGGMLPIPHSIICACLLPIVMEVNLRALNARQPGSDYLYRYQGIARILTNNPNALAVDGVHWIQALCSQLGVQKLGSYGLQRNSFPEIIEKASRTSSMRGNPILLNIEEHREILDRAI